jgi:RNase adaptor protein for sRNA GlmZ degradation
MNYNELHPLELQDVLGVYLFERENLESGIKNNAETLEEFKDVINFQQMKNNIDCTDLIYNNSIKFIDSEIKKVLECNYGMNVESFKFYEGKNVIVVDFGHDFEEFKIN